MKRKSSMNIEELLEVDEEIAKKSKSRTNVEQELNELKDGESGKVEKPSKSETSAESSAESEAETSDEWELLESEDDSDSEREENLRKGKTTKTSKPRRRAPKKSSQEKLKLNPKVENVTISRNSILSAMQLLERPKRKFDKRKREVAELSDNCYCKFPKDISYETKYYFMRHFKESVLNRKWELLPGLLELFMNSISLAEFKKYETYFIELTHMILQVHANFGSADVLREFTDKFFVFLKQDQRLTPFDAWYFDH